MLSERMVRLTRRLMNVLFPSGWDNIQFDAVHEALRAAAREAAIAENEACALIVRDAETMWGDKFTEKYGDVTAEQAVSARREGL